MGWAEEWGAKSGVVFEKGKMEWIALCKGDEEGTSKLRLPKGGEKEEAKVVRWLGVWIDRGRNFKEHVRRKVASGKRVASVIRRLGSGGRGIGVGNARKMYIACARMTMEYGSRVWWRGQTNLAGSMDKADETAMRKPGGHYRSAPGAAIMVENDMRPT